MIDLNSLKLYTKKISERKFIETANESEIDSFFSPEHKYTFEITPCRSQERYHLLCRLNVEQNKKRLTFENIDYSNIRKSKAIINTQQGVCNVSISNPDVYGWDGYSIAYPLRGDGQCLASSSNPYSVYTFILDKIANLSSISFFPSWNRAGVRAKDFNGNRYSTSVKVKVLCDDEEIFNGEITGLVANDRIYVTFDTYNQCHLEKINVGSAAAFANY